MYLLINIFHGHHVKVHKKISPSWGRWNPMIIFRLFFVQKKDTRTALRVSFLAALVGAFVFVYSSPASAWRNVAEHLSYFSAIKFTFYLSIEVMTDSPQNAITHVMHAHCITRIGGQWNVSRDDGDDPYHHLRFRDRDLDPAESSPLPLAWRRPSLSPSPS